MSKYWYLSTSDDYLSGFENEEFEQNAVSAFEEVLFNSPEAYEVIHKGNLVRMVVQDQDDSQKKKILSRLGTIERGDLILHKNLNWLVMDFVDDNKMYQVAKAQLCNTDLEFSASGGEREPIGYDDWNNPIYDDTPTSLPSSIPCIAEMKIVDETLNSPINLESDQIKITIPYIPMMIESFRVYDEDYRVKSVDQTRVINGKGILIIIGERS